MAIGSFKSFESQPVNANTDQISKIDSRVEFILFVRLMVGVAVTAHTGV